MSCSVEFSMKKFYNLEARVIFLWSCSGSKLFANVIRRGHELQLERNS